LKNPEKIAIYFLRNMKKKAALTFIFAVQNGSARFDQFEPYKGL
jgi:hypothetical protein